MRKRARSERRRGNGNTSSRRASDGAPTTVLPPQCHESAASLAVYNFYFAQNVRRLVRVYTIGYTIDPLHLFSWRISRINGSFSRPRFDATARAAAIRNFIGFSFEFVSLKNWIKVRFSNIRIWINFQMLLNVWALIFAFWNN